MYLYQGFHCKPWYILVAIVILFSSCHARPKEDPDVVEMQLQQDTVPDQVQPPAFETNGREEDNGDDGGGGGSNRANNEDAEAPAPVINVHDARSRAMADYLKQMPYQAGDMEEIMHGGNHVHGEEHEGPKQAIGIGGAGLEDLMGGEKEKEEDKGSPSTIDTEQLMHDGQGGEHGHNPHQGEHKKEEHGPTAENPEDLLHMRDMEIQADELSKRVPGVENPEERAHKMDHHSDHHQRRADDRSNENGHQVGVAIEEVIHGDGQDHDHEVEVTEEYVDDDGVTHTRKVGKQVTVEDIENLGLTKKDLEGIDLGKLLRRDQSEYETWKEDQKEQKDKGFWDRVDDFRSNYFNMLSRQIRHLSRLNTDDDPEWEDDGDDDDDPHPGESRVDHESEMWGSTKPKGNRRRRTFTVIKRGTHDGTEEL